MKAQMPGLRQERADVRKTIEQFKSMIFASRFEKKQVSLIDPKSGIVWSMLNGEFKGFASYEGYTVD